MLGRNHLVCSVAFSLPLAFAVYQSNALTLLQIALFEIGIILGCLLPDSDESGSKIYNSPALAVAFATRWLVLLPCSIILFALGDRKAFGHRNLLHSIAGLLATLFSWIALGQLVSFYTKASFFWLASFAGGVAIGWCLHLLEDSVTVHGVTPLYPLKLVLKGKMKTGTWTLAFWRSEMAAVVYTALLTGAQLAISIQFGFTLVPSVIAWIVGLLLFRVPFIF